MYPRHRHKWRVSDSALEALLFVILLGVVALMGWGLWGCTLTIRHEVYLQKPDWLGSGDGTVIAMPIGTINTNGAPPQSDDERPRTGWEIGDEIHGDEP